MPKETHRKLAQHLDRLPGGFRSQDEATDLRLLRMLFTPPDAELATQLSLEREPASAIGARAGLSAEEAERQLADMARRRLIMPVHRHEGPTLYQAMPFVVGIYEFQLDREDDEWLRAVSAAQASPRATRPRRRRMAAPRDTPLPRCRRAHRPPPESRVAAA